MNGMAVVLSGAGQVQQGAEGRDNRVPADTGDTMCRPRQVQQGDEGGGVLPAAITADRGRGLGAGQPRTGGWRQRSAAPGTKGLVAAVVELNNQRSHRASPFPAGGQLPFAAKIDPVGFPAREVPLCEIAQVIRVQMPLSARRMGR
jgi:hypothetical protein